MTYPVLCNACGLRTDWDSPCVKPCPRCGSSNRTLLLAADDGVGMADGTARIRREGGETTGVYVDERRRGLSAEVDGDRVRTRAYGEPSKGEDDTRLVVKVLIERLNSRGGCWGRPRIRGHGAKEQDGLDAEAHAPDGSILRIQVVTAFTERSFWSSLRHSGAAMDERSLKQAIRDIESSINTKLSRIATPAQREETTLALGAVRAAAHALPRVVSAFVDARGRWAASLGFRDVWIVGPSAALTRKLA